MGRGKPPWEPMTSETAEAFLAKLKLAHDELSACVSEMQKWKQSSIPMHVTTFEKPLGHVVSFCEAAHEKVERVALERKLYGVCNEEKNQQIHQERQAAGPESVQPADKKPRKAAKKKRGT